MSDFIQVFEDDDNDVFTCSNKIQETNQQQQQQQQQQQVIDIQELKDKKETETEKEDDDDDDDEKEAQNLQKQIHHLQNRILQIRNQRQLIQNRTTTLLFTKSQHVHRLNSDRTAHTRALSSYSSITSRLEFVEKELNISKSWNVTNDCFHIWHRGPYGTINGLRLGGEVSPLHPAALGGGDGGRHGSVGKRMAAMSVGEAISSATATFVKGSNANSTDTVATTTGGGTDLISSLFSGGAGIFSYNDSSNTSTAAASSASSITPPPPPPQRVSSKYDAFKVPWPEINAALGLSALLLDTLQRKRNSGITFKTHEIMPLGIATKIGVKPSPSSTTTKSTSKKQEKLIWYNLFYSEDSYSAFQYFTKRNFNVALQGLLKCLQDASEVALKKDKTLSLPHEITCTSRGEMIIGGLPISYYGGSSGGGGGGTGGGSTGSGSTGSGGSEKEGERWTRALKYFLTDLKWVVAFTVKHVDR